MAGIQRTPATSLDSVEIGGRKLLGSSPRRWRFTLPIVILAAAAILGGCGVGKQSVQQSVQQSVLHPAGPVAAIQLNLLYESLAVMTVVFIIVLAFFLYSVIRFRAREGQTELPPQIHSNLALEILWTAIPIVIIIGLAIPTVHYSFVLGDQPKGTNVMTVDVIGHQFWWEFDYPAQGIKTANVLHIPAGVKIDLNLESVDVIHSFWVPELAGKTDLIPGRVNTLWLEANQNGTFNGQCAQFCGVGHALMKFTVVAESQGSFTAWVNGMQNPVGKPTTKLEQQGFALFQQNCSICHSITGTPFAGHIGPNLTNLTWRPTIAAGTLPNTPADLAEWLHNPQAVKSGSLMPNLHLSQTDIHALVSYLETLK